jgi:propanediol dehydratase small subunit
MPVKYPVSENHPENLQTPSGIPFREITLGAVRDGRVSMEDLRVTAAALEMQAQIADSRGRRQLAENLRRAAELVTLPEREIVAIYSSMRPGRASGEELHKMADTLVERYGARRCAALLHEAATFMAESPMK